MTQATAPVLQAPETAAGVPLPFAYEDVKVGMVGSGAGFCQALLRLHALAVPIAAVGTHRSLSEEQHSEELQGYRRLGMYQDLGEVAQRIGARFMRAPDLNAEGCVRALKAWGVNLILSVSAPVLREAFVHAFSGFVFNMHGSAVYRGRAGLTWAILNNLQADRLVLHWVAPAIDAGKIVAQQPYHWPARSYPIDIMQALFRAYGPLLADLVSILQAGRVPCADPGNDAKLYFPLIRGERDGAIQWDWPPEIVESFVRAFGWPYIGAFGCFRGSGEVEAQVHIARCEVAKDDARFFHPQCNGVAVRYGPDDSVDVVAGGRLLRVLTIRKGWDELPARAAVRLGGRFVSTGAARDR